MLRGPWYLQLSQSSMMIVRLAVQNANDQTVGMVLMLFVNVYQYINTHRQHLTYVNAAVMYSKNSPLPVVVQNREVHVFGHSTMNFSLHPLDRQEQRL